MKKLFTLVIALVMIVACSFGVFAACDSSSEPLVGLICLHGDQSTYDKNFIDAFKAACEAKGIGNKYKIVTNVEESDACKENAINLVEQGCKLVFADSFGHEKYLMSAAKEYSDVQFCHGTGVSALVNKDTVPNFHNAFASIYKGRYLTGVAAGLKLKEMIDNNTLPTSSKMQDGNYLIGYVGAYTYAEVISGYTSFYLGVKSVVSNVTMKVKFTGSWYDETAEKEAAKSLITEGCALISQHADSMGAPTACEEAGIPNVCYNVSTENSCPDTYIIASKINWQPYFEYIIDCTLNGTAIDTDKCGELSDNSVVVLDPGTAAANGTAEKIAEVKAKLQSGELEVFDCSKFTVTVTDNKNANATVDADGHLTAYLADCDGDYTGEKNVIVDGAFKESLYRSAPYFDVQIDGIELLNSKY